MATNSLLKALRGTDAHEDLPRPQCQLEPHSMKKLPNDGKKRCKRNQWRIYAADSGFCRRTCQCCYLPRAFETACGPLGPERWSLTENTTFGRFSAGLLLPNQLGAVAEFLFLADWPPYLQDLNSLDFSTSSVLQPIGQATTHANLTALHPSVTAEWD